MNHCILLSLLLLLACAARTSGAECADCVKLETFQTLMDVVNKLQAKVIQLEKAVDGVKVPKDQTHLQDRRFVLTGTTGVAFSVTVLPLDISHLGAHQTIRFDNVITNLGNGYNQNSGVFTAPITGWYVFSLTLMDNPNELQRLDVVKDGVHIFHCYVHGNAFDTASRTMVLQVNKGSAVWVQTHYVGNPTVHGDQHTSFTGFLLYSYE